MGVWRSSPGHSGRTSTGKNSLLFSRVPGPKLSSWMISIEVLYLRQRCLDGGRCSGDRQRESNAPVVAEMNFHENACENARAIWACSLSEQKVPWGGAIEVHWLLMEECFFSVIGERLMNPSLRLGIVVLAFLLFPFRAFASQDALLCTNCSSESHFNAAAKNFVGPWFHGEKEILVVNPNTGVSYFVFVHGIVGGLDPYGGAVGPHEPQRQSPINSRLDSEKLYVEDAFFHALYPGEIVSLGRAQSDHGIVTLDLDAPFATASNVTTQSQRASAAQEQEIGAIIDFGKNRFAVVLPDNGYFGSFSTREPSAVALQLYQSMTAHNPAWANNSIGKALRETLFKRLKSLLGRDMLVCAIFRNGDSACYSLEYMTPSAEHYKDGTAKDASGNPIGGGGSGGLYVDSSSPPVTRYFFPGSGLYLFCQRINGEITHCWTEWL